MAARIWFSARRAARGSGTVPGLSAGRSAGMNGMWMTAPTRGARSRNRAVAVAGWGQPSHDDQHRDPAAGPGEGGDRGRRGRGG